MGWDKGIVNPKFQAFDSNGDPLSGGLVYTYESGTTTPKTTYKERALTNANDNPVVLDSRGEAAIYATGLIKLVLKTSAGVTVWTMDAMRVTQPPVMSDDDGDTQIQVEESADEDIIRFDIGGTEQINLTDGALLPTTDADVDIGDSSHFFKLIYSWLANLRGFAIRPRFAWKDTDEIYISAGAYEINDKLVWWNSLLTSDIGSPDASDMYYLYLDDSAITKSGIITTTELIWANTEPAWSETKHGWYNGADRCIFAVLTDASTYIIEFYHEADLVAYVDEIVERAAAALSTTWVDVDMKTSVPKFTQKVLCSFIGTYVNVDGNTGYWQPNGTISENGHPVTYSAAGVTKSINTTPVITDHGQIIEVKMGGIGTDTMAVAVNGWFFPIGL